MTSTATYAGAGFERASGRMTAAVVGEEDPVAQRVAGVLSRHSYNVVFHASPTALLQGLAAEPESGPKAAVRGAQARSRAAHPRGRPQTDAPGLFVFACQARQRGGGSHAWPGDWLAMLKALNARIPRTAILVVIRNNRDHDIIKRALAAGADEIISDRDTEIDELVWTRVQSALAKADVCSEIAPAAWRAAPGAAAASGGATPAERRVAERRRGDRRGGDVAPLSSTPRGASAGDVVEEWEEPTPADEVHAAQERVRAALPSLPSAAERTGPLADVLGITASALRAGSGRLDAKKIAEHLGVSLAKLAQITPISRQALNDTPDSVRVQAALDPLARILDVLASVLPPEHVRAWLNASHARLGGETPLHVILEGRAEQVARMLEVARDGGVE
jgi:DNA-binding NarL/FixJ family response regulator